MLILDVLCVTALAGVGYYEYKKYKAGKKAIPAVPVTTATNPSPTKIATLPDGVSWADAPNGLVYLSALEKYYPGRKYAVKQTEEFLQPDTAAYFGVLQNVANCTFAENDGEIQYGVFSPAVPNPATGGFSLATNKKISGVFVCPESHPTYSDAVAWLSGVAEANINNPNNNNGGAGFSPVKSK
jgi:hypothetical protein